MTNDKDKTMTHKLTITAAELDGRHIGAAVAWPLPIDSIEHGAGMTTIAVTDEGGRTEYTAYAPGDEITLATPDGAYEIGYLAGYNEGHRDGSAGVDHSWQGER